MLWKKKPPWPPDATCICLTWMFLPPKFLFDCSLLFCINFIRTLYFTACMFLCDFCTMLNHQKWTYDHDKDWFNFYYVSWSITHKIDVFIMLTLGRWVCCVQHRPTNVELSRWVHHWQRDSCRDFCWKRGFGKGGNFVREQYWWMNILVTYLEWNNKRYNFQSPFKSKNSYG